MMLRDIVDAQYRRPSGLLGRYIARRMERDHLPKNLWTVHPLDARPTDRILEIGFGPGFAIEALVQKVTNIGYR